MESLTLQLSSLLHAGGKVEKKLALQIKSAKAVPHGCAKWNIYETRFKN
jgi:hypothetical protein